MTLLTYPSGQLPLEMSIFFCQSKGCFWKFCTWKSDSQKNEIRTKLEHKLNKLGVKSIEIISKFEKQLEKAKQNIETDSRLSKEKFDKEREKAKLKEDLTHLFYNRFY